MSYTAYRFAPAEGWHLRSEGNAGGSRRERQRWLLDFSVGARAHILSVPDRVLAGNVDRIHVRARGSAKGHPVRLVLRTHFMTFEKVIGEFSGTGEQELVTYGPPGAGWEWHSGENDGKLHGPLRLGEIQFLANNRPDRCKLELREIVIDGSCPPEKRAILLAEGPGDIGDPAFRVKARALTDKPLAGELRWILRDWGQKEVGHGEQAISIPAKTLPIELKVAIPRHQMSGRLFLEGEFELNIPGQEVATARAAWLAPIYRAGDSSLMPGSPFGMGVYLNRYGGNEEGLAEMEQAAQYARDAGVKWSREDFSWDRIERERGKFDWTFYDNLVACAKRNGISVCGIACYWSSWTKPYTAEGIQDYLNYLRAMVRHYRWDIHYWEIWNEPNIFFWQGPKEMYAELLIKSYAVIKQEHPDAHVLGLSTAGVDTRFIDRMLALKTPFDILTIHPYRPTLDDLGFINELKKVSDQVRLPDGTRRPVWLTEMGWATHTPHNTLRQDFAPTSLRSQAELLARSYLCAIVSGVEPRTFWYDFRNDGDDPIYFEHQMGIVYSDFRPKPAYAAYAVLTEVLKGKRLGKQLTTPSDIIAYRFTSDSSNAGDVIAIWAPKTTCQIDLPVSGEKVIRVNAIGERSELKAVGGTVHLNLRAGSPEYILVGR